MKGQWHGEYSGSEQGYLILNIDEIENQYYIRAYFIPKNTDTPLFTFYYITNTNEPLQILNVKIDVVDKFNRLPTTWKKIKGLYPNISSPPENAKVKILFENDLLKLNLKSNRVKAKTNIEIDINFESSTKQELTESNIQSETMSWKEFKNFVSDNSKYNYLYRGQKKPWPLTTSFHRRGRFEMLRFVSNDVQQLHRRLSAMTTHYFNLNNSNENGSFFNLIQHHGYPTPLLDWTLSPYIAAYFAFKDWPKNHTGSENVRIYIFNIEEWTKNNQQIQHLDPAMLHLSLSEFIAIDNPRLITQQSKTTITNIYDIEAYIRMAESTKDGIWYLKAIDIPANEREFTINELRIMGITSGSMFPTLDGVCAELKETNFDE
ncbi:MAG: FRG domain-containing protein [Candidatus Thiodiazotropha sp. 'RUGA']|nr:FRG domain-containing protein [Candidatus Thiodiazotropha sp. 'RUGA']